MSQMLPLSSNSSPLRAATPDARVLNFQADQIERVLAVHRAPARVSGGRLTPRAVEFHLTLDPRTKIHRLEALTEEVALALGAPSVRLTREAGRLALEIPRSARSTVSLLALDQELSRDENLLRALRVTGTAILGLDTEGVPLLLRLSSPDVAHVLIAGTTGSGKTELVRTILASLLLHQKAHDLLLALFDPRGRGLAPFSAAPHLLFPLVQEAEDAATRMQRLVKEMERRETRRITRPRIVVVVDELADMLQTCSKEFESHLTRLVQRGRNAGMSVILSTQKPTAAAIGSLLKANLPLRLVGKVASADDARVAAGIGGSGAEKLQGRGDFVLVAGGQMIRFQSAQITEREIERVVHPPAIIPFPSRWGLGNSDRAVES